MMKNKQLLLFVFLFVFTLSESFSFRLLAQSIPPIHFTQYTTDNGLPHDIGYQMLQDEEGYLWIGTDNGLARFDGFQFTTFADEAGLTNPFPIDMALSKDQDMYIGTWGNGVFKKTKDTIVHLPMDLNNLKISRVNFLNPNFLKIWVKGVDKKTNHLMYTQCQIGLQEREVQEVIFFEQEGICYKAIESLHQEKNNISSKENSVINNFRGEVVRNISPSVRLRNKQEIYFTTKGILKNDPSTSLVKSNRVGINYLESAEEYSLVADIKSLLPLDKQLEGVLITSLAEDKNGGLWLGAKGEIYHLATNGNLSTYSCLSSESSPFELAIWQDKFLVFFSNDDRSKLFLLEMGNGHIHDLSTRLELLTTVSDIYVDKEDNLWVTTDGSGLYCFSPFLARNYAQKEGLENIFIYEIIETDDGTLFAATKGGVFLFKNENWMKVDQALTNVDLRSGVEISTDGHLWLGGGGGSRDILVELKIPFLTTTQMEYKEMGRNFYIDSKKRIWSMEFLGFCFDSYRSDELESLHQVYKKEGWDIGFSKAFLESFFAIQELRHDQFVALEVEQEEMLIGTSRGLFVVSGNSFEHFSKETGLPSTVVHDIVQSEDGRIWIATEKGICIKDGDRFIPVTTEGLISSQCRKLLFDHKGQLWVGTPAGLHYFISSEKTWIPITKNMGLVANDITALFEDSQKRLWVGTSRGISMLPNNKPQKRLSAPAISIEKILLNKQDYKKASPEKRFPFRSTVRIVYNAIAFQSAKELLFQYRMNTEEAWKATTSRSVVFSDLADGSYDFEIRVKKPNSNWSEPEKFTFTVQPPWYRSLWFFLFAGFSLFAIGRFLFLQRIRLERKKIEAQAQIKEELAQLEMKALQAQMNPHFIFNAMNSIMDFVMNEDKYVANQYLAKFARLMRLFLEASSSNYLSLAEELEMITLYVELEKLRFKDKFDFKIFYDDKLPIDVLEIPSMLVQPFIENAIHHGLYLKEGKGQLELRIVLVEQQLKIQIEDNGVGRAAALAAKKQSIKSYKSRGTQIVQEKIALLNTRQDDHFSVVTLDLKDATGRPTGTRVCIDISIQD